MGTIRETIEKYFSRYDEDEDGSKGKLKKVYKKKKKKKKVRAGSYLNPKHGSAYEKALDEASDY
jgi:hypothetical protein